MKKIIAIFAFFAITLLSTDATFAQESNSRNLNINAKAFTHQLSKQFKLDGPKQRAIYNAHMLKERKTNALTHGTEEKKLTKDQVTKKDAIISEFNSKLKAVLTPEQFKKYTGLLIKG